MKTIDAVGKVLCGSGNSLCTRRLGFCTALALIAICTFTGSQSVSAQAVYGSIFGTVTDSTGAVVPNATVTVTDVSKGTSVSTVANATGDYRVDHLIPDTYSVTADAPNFQKS